MREIRLSSSEGGVALTLPSLPLSRIGPTWNAPVCQIVVHVFPTVDQTLTVARPASFSTPADYDLKDASRSVINPKLTYQTFTECLFRDIQVIPQAPIMQV